MIYNRSSVPTDNETAVCEKLFALEKIEAKKKLIGREAPVAAAAYNRAKAVQTTGAYPF